jgi:hypothetical protein
MNGNSGTTSSDVISKKVPVCGYDIYCETRGKGPNVVFFFPGAMGTCTTDFQDQYSGFDLSKFTIVTWDAPGYGNSRPPKRNTVGNYYKRDAPVAIALMKVRNDSFKRNLFAKQQQNLTTTVVCRVSFPCQSTMHDTCFILQLLCCR